MNRFSINELARTALFLGLFVLSVFAIKSLNVFTDRYFHVGFEIFIYNIARVVFLAYMGWLAYQIGARIIGVNYIENSPNPLSFENFLLCSFAGTASLNILFVIIGLLETLHFLPIMIGTSLLILLFRLSNRILPPWRTYKDSKLVRPTNAPERFNSIIFGISVLLVVYLLIARGLIPEKGMDQIALYIPYYETVLAKSSLWPNHWFLGNYYARGDGLRLFAILLTDVQSLQLISFYLLLLSGGLLFCAVQSHPSEVATDEKQKSIKSRTRLLSRTRQCKWQAASRAKIASLNPVTMLLALLAVILFLTSEILEPNFQKPHLHAGMLVLFIVYAAAKIIHAPEEKVKPWKRALFLAAISVTLVSPQMSFLVIAFGGILFLFVLFMDLSNRSLAEPNGRGIHFVCLFVFTMVTVGTVYLFNYMTTGLPEISPHRFFRPFRNEEILHQWVSNAMLTYFEFIQALLPAEGSLGQVGTAPAYLRPSNLFSQLASFGLLNGPLPATLAMIVSISASVYLIRFCKRLPRSHPALALVVSSCALLLVVVGLRLSVTQASIQRLTVFSVWMYSFLTLLFTSQLMMLLNRFGVLGKQKFYLALMLVASVESLLQMESLNTLAHHLTC